MINIGEITSYINQAFWPMIRISGLVLTAPIFSHNSLPGKVKILTVVMLGLFIAPMLSNVPSVNLSIENLLIVARELLLGVLMGFILQIVLQIFAVGGQIVAMQSGLGFATMVDPSSSNHMPLVSTFYLILVSLIYLSLDGHLLLVRLLLDSFSIIPIGEFTVIKSQLVDIVKFSALLFAGGVIVAIPAIISLLVVNLSFAIMTRSAPQLNIFAIGFPITLVLGIAIVAVSLGVILPQFNKFLQQAMTLASSVLR